MAEKPSVPNSERVGVNSFAIGDVIGQGSFSKVMIARKKNTSDFYAIKILNKTFITKEGKEKAVMAERDALVKARHPFDAQNLFFVTTLCQGGSLWDIIKTLRLPGRGCSPELIRFYMAEIVSAIDYLHNTINLIHRDLKPENILISGTGHIMLSDFGAITSNKNDFSSRRNSLCGTILYLSPEIIQGEAVSASVDIWSMGCIMYLLFTGTFLFEGEDEVNVVESIQHFCVDMVEFSDYVPADARDLMRRMLQYDPINRINTTQIINHPYFGGLDFRKLPDMQPPYIPPFIPLPVIYDDPLENELNALRGSIDETFRTAQEEKKEAINKLLKEGEYSLFSSTVIHMTKTVYKKRLLVLTSNRRILIMDSLATAIKTEFLPKQLAKVEINQKGFNLCIDFPRKKFKFSTPGRDQSVWCNCVEYLIKSQNSQT